ncbi:MAG: O-antigen polymerase [Verrucomicrobia bacterium]|nr:O-antigen polymerase [Verrucomicrobiota bacterium]
MNPRPRQFIVVAIGVILAVWFGRTVADQEFLWPALGAMLVGLMVVQRSAHSLNTILLGIALLGYIVGNRGFAQLSVSSLLPILPAEFVILVCGSVVAVQSAFRGELPLRRGPLNFAIIGWIALGVVRGGFDLSTHGFLALRDLAMVYYAAFFFLAQEAGRDPRSRRFLRNVILAGCLILLPLYELYERYPEFFLSVLTVRGVPLIYYKGDLVGTFLAVGAVLFFLRYEAEGRIRNIAASLLLAAGAIATNNRASMLGLLVATAWLALGGRWRFAVTQAAAGATAILLILIGATIMNIPFKQTPTYGLYERTLSLVDFRGQRVYESADSLNKGDNNTFRRVWWQAVFNETMEGNPIVGLGFGYNLADRFAREYYAEGAEEFATRSPHNFLLTIFARMGIVGLAAFVVVLAIVARRTCRAIRMGPAEAAPWCSIWVIFSAACLGVVLEGPMGAVIFWTLLGLANAEYLDENEEAVGEAAADLIPQVTPDEVPSSL